MIGIQILTTMDVGREEMGFKEARAVSKERERDNDVVERLLQANIWLNTIRFDEGERSWLISWSLRRVRE